MKLFKYIIVKISLFIISTNLVFTEQMADTNQPKVSIHAEDTYLPTILSRLAKQSGYNIVTGPSVSAGKKLTIHLDDTPILEALDLIIRASGLSYEVKGNSILVAESSKLNEEIGLIPHIVELSLHSNLLDYLIFSMIHANNH